MLKQGPGFEACNDPKRTAELVADPEDIHNFYECVDSGEGYFFAYLKHCPELTAFDASTQTCEWES